MKNYHAEVINLSLKDKEMIKKYPLLSVKKRYLGYVKIFYLSGKGITPVYQKCINTSHADDKQKWDEMISYAKTLGIPDEQCDFLPEDFDKMEY
ncbi:MAG: hypothetical protein PHN48_10905 [Parabacteroides sp.]|nr:hypothetical protein [Parabacteroides sp.]